MWLQRSPELPSFDVLDQLPRPQPERLKHETAVMLLGGIGLFTFAPLVTGFVGLAAIVGYLIALLFSMTWICTVAVRGDRQAAAFQADAHRHLLTIHTSVNPLMQTVRVGVESSAGDIYAQRSFHAHADTQALEYALELEAAIHDHLDAYEQERLDRVQIRAKLNETSSMINELVG